MNDGFGPLSIGEIADRSVNIAVRRWRTLSVLVLLEALPMGLMRVALPESWQAYVLHFVVDLVLVALLYPAAVLTTVAPHATPGSMLKAAAGRYGAALATTIISIVWIVFWFALSALVGAVIMLPFAAVQLQTATLVAFGVAAGATGLAVLPRAGLVAAIMLPIVILERTTPGDALARARRRVNHAGFVRSSLLGLAIFAVSVAPALAADAALEAVVTLTNHAALSMLEELLADGVTLGLGIVLGTVASLEMRARYEGADLEAELETGVR